MAKFDPFVRHIFNKLFNDRFINEFKDDLNEILPLIISGKLPLPKNNITVNDLLSSLTIDECNFYKTLTFDDNTSGLRNKKGFNKLTIISTFIGQDVKPLLNSINSQHTLSSIQLSQLKKLSNGNFLLCKCLSNFINGYERLLINPNTDTNVQYRFFNYLFNRITDYTDSGNISFIYLYCFYLLFNVYQKLARFELTTYKYIYNNNKLLNTQISTEFNNYYQINKLDIVNNLSSYCYTNIFSFGSNYTPLFDNIVDTRLSNSVNNLITKFTSNINQFIPTHFVSTVLPLITDQICSHTIIENLNNNEFNSQLQSLININDFAPLELEEDAIYKNIKNYVLDHITDLEELEYISFQFNTTPLFFINSYLFLHYVYTSDLLDDMEKSFSIESWIAKLELQPTFNSALNQFITTHQFIITRKTIYDCCKSLFADTIMNFIDSDIVTNWIIVDFFPTLLNGIKVNYHVTTDIYQHVDNIKCILKFIFITDLFNDKIFVQYMDELYDYIILNNMDNIEMSEKTIELIVKSISSSKISNYLNGIYKSAYVNNYLNLIFSKYSI